MEGTHDVVLFSKISSKQSANLLKLDYVVGIIVGFFRLLMIVLLRCPENCSRGKLPPGDDQGLV